MDTSASNPGSGRPPRDLWPSPDRLWRASEESGPGVPAADDASDELELFGYLGLHLKTDLLMERLRGPVDQL